MSVRLGMAFLGGFIGTLLITAMSYVVSPLIAGVPTDIAALLSEMLGGSWIAGLIAHFMIGTLILPTLYALFVFSRLKGHATVRGMTWGAILWLFAQTIVMPMTGAGFFSANVGGLLSATGSLLGHLLYGLSLGLFSGGPNEDSERHMSNATFRVPGPPRHANRRSWSQPRSAARGGHL